MKELPYWKFMVGDWFKGDVQCCSHHTKGIFTDLCAQLWRKGGYLPDNNATLASLCRCTTQDFSNARDELVQWDILKSNGDSTVHVDFILEQLEELAESHKKRVDAGRKGGNTKQLNRSSKAKAKLKQCSSISDTDTESDTDSPPLTPRKREKGFKSWSLEEFRVKCEEGNVPQVLTPPEVDDFIAYWTEPSSSGRFKFTLERTWDSRRRMGTALRIVYSQRRNSPTSTSPRHPERQSIDELCR